jgi:hypothetical protein
MPRKMKPEEILKRALTRWLSLQYPNLIWRYDVAADIKMNVGQARKSKALHGHQRGFPDLMIFRPAGEWCGLALELKAENVRLRKKDGTWASEHLREQAEMLRRLVDEGYCAAFAIGFDDARKKIQYYLEKKICPDTISDWRRK